MNAHIFAAGQFVRVGPASLSGPMSMDDFRVIHRYPGIGAPDFYRLQSLADPSERMVPAGEMTASRDPAVHAGVPVEPVSQPAVRMAA